MEAPEQPFPPKVPKYLSAVDEWSFIVTHSFLRCLLLSARELCKTVPVSLTLNKQFCRTWYHVSSLQQFWDRKGVQKGVQILPVGRSFGKIIFIPTVPSALPSQVSLGWVWGRCLWRAGFSPGDTAPTWNPEMGRKATTQRAGQVMVAGPYTGATYSAVSTCPQQLLKGGNIIQSRDGHEPFLRDITEQSSFFLGVGVYHPAPLHFQRSQEASLERESSTWAVFHLWTWRWYLTQQGFSQQKDEQKKTEEKPSKVFWERGSGVKGHPLWSLPCQEPGLLAPVMLGKTQLHPDTHFWGQGSCNHRDDQICLRKQDTRGFCKQQNQIQKI